MLELERLAISNRYIPIRVALSMSAILQQFIRDIASWALYRPSGDSRDFSVN